jgi:hypothetical protein
LERRFQQRDELALRILDHVVERTRLEGGHDQFAVLGAGDEDDRGMVRDRMNARKRAEPVETRHVLVERDDVEFLAASAFRPLSPSDAQTTRIPSRSSPRETRRRRPSSSSI